MYQCPASRRTPVASPRYGPRLLTMATSAKTRRRLDPVSNAAADFFRETDLLYTTARLGEIIVDQVP